MATEFTIEEVSKLVAIVGFFIPTDLFNEYPETQKLIEKAKNATETKRGEDGDLVAAAEVVVTGQYVLKES